MLLSAPLGLTPAPPTALVSSCSCCSLSPEVGNLGSSVPCVASCSDVEVGVPGWGARLGDRGIPASSATCQESAPMSGASGDAAGTAGTATLNGPSLVLTLVPAYPCRRLKPCCESLGLAVVVPPYVLSCEVLCELILCTSIDPDGLRFSSSSSNGEDAEARPFAPEGCVRGAAASGL